MACSAGPNVVQDGIALSVDTGNTKSYPESGTTLFDQIESNDMTLYNGPTFSPQYNGFLTLDGSNDTIGYTDMIDDVTNFEKTQNYSIEFWFKNKNSASDSEKWLIDLYDSPNGYPYTIRNRSGTTSGQMGMNLFNGSTHKSVAFDCKRNEWKHFVFSADWVNATSTSGKIYVDGVLVQTISQVGFTDASLKTGSTYDWRIGGRGTNTGNAMNCDFALCRTYRKALSAVEAKRNFLALKGRFEL